MDNLVRRKKGEDLIFQNMEEKALLQKQALQEERAEELYRKMGMAGISPAVVFQMVDDGKKLPEIMDFLSAEITTNLVKDLMAHRASIGRPIGQEDARKRVRLLMTEDDSKQPAASPAFDRAEKRAVAQFETAAARVEWDDYGTGVNYGIRKKPDARKGRQLARDGREKRMAVLCMSPNPLARRI
jgi:hypothetical protein